MPLTISLVVQDRTATIAMDGDLDAQTAPIFQEQAQRAAEQHPQRLVLDMTRLGYMSSAGLRQLVYAQQKLDDDVQIVLLGANPHIEQTIRLVGLEQSVTFADSIPE